MAITARAIYENGHLRLLDGITLNEGQQVALQIVPVDAEEAALRELWGDLIAHWPDPSNDDDAYLEDMLDEIDQAFQGDPPLSQIIIEDRGTTEPPTLDPPPLTPMAGDTTARGPLSTHAEGSSVPH